MIYIFYLTNILFLFHLGIFRICLIDKLKIICIYEIPENFLTTDFEIFSNILSYLNKKSTIIIFTHTKLNNIFSSKYIYVEDSKIKLISSK